MINTGEIAFDVAFKAVEAGDADGSGDRLGRLGAYQSGALTLRQAKSG